MGCSCSAIVSADLACLGPSQERQQTLSRLTKEAQGPLRKRQASLHSPSQSDLHSAAQHRRPTTSHHLTEVSHSDAPPPVSGWPSELRPSPLRHEDRLDSTADSCSTPYTAPRFHSSEHRPDDRYHSNSSHSSSSHLESDSGRTRSRLGRFHPRRLRKKINEMASRVVGRGGRGGGDYSQHHSLGHRMRMTPRQVRRNFGDDASDLEEEGGNTREYTRAER